MSYFKTFSPNNQEQFIDYVYTYKLGLNISPDTFNSNLELQYGGFYFTDFNNIHKYFNNFENHTIVGEIELVTTSQVINKNDKYKTDKFILKNIMYISQFIEKHNLIFLCLNDNSRSLKFVKETNQTLEICQAAVLSNPYSLEYAKIQTEEMCLTAVQRNFQTFRFVIKQTPKICLEIIKNAPLLVYEIKIAYTKEMMLALVKHGGSFIKLILNLDLDNDVLLESVKSDGLTLQYVKNQTKELCIEAIKNNVNAVNYINNASLLTKSKIYKNINDLDNLNNIFNNLII
jgi:hypothetical protein